MIQVPITQVEDSLPQYLQIAEKEEVVITRQGVPAGLLIGFEDPEDLWEELLFRHPVFIEHIRQSRQSAREGRVKTIEQIRTELAQETIDDEIVDDEIVDDEIVDTGLFSE